MERICLSMILRFCTSCLLAGENTWPGCELSLGSTSICSLRCREPPGEAGDTQCFFCHPHHPQQSFLVSCPTSHVPHGFWFRLTIWRTLIRSNDNKFYTCICIHLSAKCTSHIHDPFQDSYSPVGAPTVNSVIHFYHIRPPEDILHTFHKISFLFWNDSILLNTTSVSESSQ